MMRIRTNADTCVYCSIVEVDEDAAVLEAVNDENLMEDLENALAGADELLDVPDEEEVAEVGRVLGYCLPMRRDAPDLWKYFCRITGIIQDFLGMKNCQMKSK